jgi:hypothetical protein
LPQSFLGYTTSFGAPDEFGVRLPSRSKKNRKGQVDHFIAFTTVQAFLQERLGVDDYDMKPAAWLTVPQQRLLEVTSGRIFRELFGDAVRTLRARKKLLPRLPLGPLEGRPLGLVLLPRLSALDTQSLPEQAPCSILQYGHSPSETTPPAVLASNWWPAFACPHRTQLPYCTSVVLAADSLLDTSVAMLSTYRGLTITTSVRLFSVQRTVESRGALPLESVMVAEPGVRFRYDSELARHGRRTRRKRVVCVSRRTAKEASA